MLDKFDNPIKLLRNILNPNNILIQFSIIVKNDCGLEAWWEIDKDNRKTK